jgi:hypothetical protein
MFFAWFSLDPTAWAAEEFLIVFIPELML